MWWTIRIAARRAARRPYFSLAVIVLLGGTLGIATTVGGLARAALGTALPFANEGRLVVLTEWSAEHDVEEMASSLPSVEEWRRRSRLFEEVGATRAQLSLTLEAADGVARVSGGLVTPELFGVLGVDPVLGRSFTAEEGRAGAHEPAVILGHGFWLERLGGDAGAVGRSLAIDGRQRTVVGVLGEGQDLAPGYPEVVDVWLPMGWAEAVLGRPVLTSRVHRSFRAIGRLRPGVTEEDLSEELDRISDQLAADFPDASEGWRWQAESLRDVILGPVRGPVAALFGGGLTLLAVGFVNLLGLFVQRARDGEVEIATRLALGGTWRDVAHLQGLEAALLGLAAAVLATAITAAGLGSIPAWSPVDLPPHVDVGFGPIHGLVAALVALVLALAVGAASIGVVARHADILVTTAGRQRRSLRGVSRGSRLTLGFQVALTTVLAVGAAATMRSYAGLSGADAGVARDGLMTLRLDVPAEARADEELVPVTDEILRQLTDHPSVERAVLWTPHVPSEATWFTRVRLADRPEVRDAELPAVRFHTVSPGAVEALGLDIVAGRDMTLHDRESGRRVVLVSESAAREWWGEDDAVGKQLRRWNHDAWSDVVGVVADAPLSGRQGEGSDFRRDVYFLYGQDLQRYLVVPASARDGARLAEADLRAAVSAAAPDLPVYDVRSMDDRLTEQEAVTRSTAFLGITYAMAAIFLAAVGLYGSISYTVCQRRAEIGLRQALGANTLRVTTELTASSLVTVLVGWVGGLVVAWYGLGLMDATLFNIGRGDFPSYAFASFVLLGVAGAALGYPALQGARKNPAASLREAVCGG